MTNAKKMTKKDYFNALLNIKEVGTNEKLVAFIEHELELLERKSNKASGDKKPTAKQIENMGVKQAIIDGMEENTLYTITDLQKNIEECAELSNQKVAALLRQLIEEEMVERVVDKRKTYFKLK